jgi:hypothetical protein
MRYKNRRAIRYALRPLHLAVLLGGLLWNCGDMKQSQRPLEFGVQVSGISVHQVGAFGQETFLHPNVLRGDWVLIISTLKVVIAGQSRNHRRRYQPRSIIYATFGGIPLSRLTEYQQTVKVNGRKLLWRHTDIVPETENGVLGLAVYKRDRRGNWKMKTRISSTPDMTAVDVVTQAVHRRDKPISEVTVGSEIWWDGGYPFVPGRGYIREKAKITTPFVAAVGERGSFHEKGPPRISMRSRYGTVTIWGTSRG